MRGKTIERNVKYWCKVRNTTLQNLAKDLKVAPSTLSKWINGGDIPGYVLKDIAFILDVPMGALIS